MLPYAPIMPPGVPKTKSPKIPWSTAPVIAPAIAAAFSLNFSIFHAPPFYILSSRHGDSDVRLRQRRCVVDAVSHHSNFLSLLLEFLDFVGLVGGKHVGQNPRDSSLFCDRFCSALVVSCKEYR